MITIKELVDTYLFSKGLKRLKGADEDASPLLPLIMMDSAYQLYCKYVKPLECKHELKKLKNEWCKSYKVFNKDFFRCYNAEQTDFICDMMDDFDKFISPYNMTAFVQFTNIFGDEELEKQKILSACMLINVLCQCSEIVYERIYAKAYERKNKAIIDCERYMHLFAEKLYGNDKKSINPNESKGISDAVDVLCKKQIYFLKNYRHED